MTCTRHLFILALIGAAVGISAAARPPKRPTKYVFVIFGDSLSDNGNNFRASGLPDPKVYYKGRFTNGPNWVDYVKQAVKPLQIFNYAYGGSTACGDPVIEKRFPFIKNLTGQVADFLADVKSGKIPTGRHVKLIVIQFIGSNDIVYPLRQALGQEGSLPTPDQLGAVIHGLVTCRVAGIQALFSVPAVKHIAVMPLAPVHAAPSIPGALVQQVKWLESAAGEATVATIKNLQAALSVAPAGYPGSGVQLYSLGTISDWMADGIYEVQPPFKVTNASCLQISTTLIPAAPELKICENPNDYMWFDDLHPTTRYHQWFATQGVLSRLRQLKLIPDSL